MCFFNFACLRCRFGVGNFVVCLRSMQIIHISDEFAQFHIRNASASSKKIKHAANDVLIFAKNSKLFSLKCVFSILHVCVADSEFTILWHLYARGACGPPMLSTSGNALQMRCLGIMGPTTLLCMAWPASFQNVVSSRNRAGWLGMGWTWSSL